MEKVLARRRFSVTARAYAGERAVDPAGGARGDAGRRQEVDLLAKAAFAPVPRTSFALGAGPIWADAPEGACSGAGGEARAAVGVSLPRGVYVAAEGARRAFSGGCSDSRAEATVGATFGRFLGLAQAFSDRERFGAATTVQVSGVVFLRRGLGLQVGVRAPLGDETRSSDMALVIGVWAKGARKS